MGDERIDNEAFPDTDDRPTTWELIGSFLGGIGVGLVLILLAALLHACPVGAPSKFRATRANGGALSHVVVSRKYTQSAKAGSGPGGRGVARGPHHSLDRGEAR